MEELPILQTIVVFLGSSQLDQLKIQFYSSNDELFSSLLIKNYTQQTIYLTRTFSNFYCVTSTPHLTNDEQFEVKVGECSTETQPYQVCRDFKSFNLRLQIFMNCQLKGSQSPQSLNRQEQQLYLLASNHLKKLQRTIFKKLDLEELKRPLGEKKSNMKKTSIRKIRTNNHLTIVPKMQQPRATDTPHDNAEIIKTLKNIGKIEGNDQTDNSQTEIPPPQLQQRGKKYNTLCDKLFRKKEDPQSQDQQDIQDSQKVIGQETPTIQKVCEALKEKQNAAWKWKRVRATQKSYLQELQIETWQALNRQKSALQLMQTIGVTSECSSRVKVHIRQLSKNDKLLSPYRNSNSSAFLKKKMILK